MKPYVVQRLIDGVENHHKVGSRTGCRASGIQHKVGHRAVKVLSLVAYLLNTVEIDHDYQGVRHLDFTS